MVVIFTRSTITIMVETCQLEMAINHEHIHWCVNQLLTIIVGSVATVINHHEPSFTILSLSIAIPPSVQLRLRASCLEFMIYHDEPTLCEEVLLSTDNQPSLAIRIRSQ